MDCITDGEELFHYDANRLFFGFILPFFDIFLNFMLCYLHFYSFLATYLLIFNYFETYDRIAAASDVVDQ